VPASAITQEIVFAGGKRATGKDQTKTINRRIN